MFGRKNSLIMGTLNSVFNRECRPQIENHLEFKMLEWAMYAFDLMKRGNSL